MPPLSEEPIPITSYSPSSFRGTSLEQEILSLVRNGAVVLALLPSPGFYSRVFLVMEASESWRPIIDLSILHALFWSNHGPSGLHEGNGSGFNFSLPFRHYDPQLVPAPSRELVLQALVTILRLFQVLGIIVNQVNSPLVPSRRLFYLGTLIASVT